jgi:uncharacterized protein YbjT (DUF2867 family)
MMKKTAIVVGATGLVGQSVVEHLVNAAHIEKVISITRSPVAYSSANVVNHVVNFERLAAYSAAFKGDILFSCLGTTLKQAGSLAAQRKVDIDYQFEAAKLALNNGVSHYLLVSSSGANEKSHSPYLKMKGELEVKIGALGFNRISIFQPSLLLGERRHFRLGERIAAYILPVICSISFLRRYRPITGNEVAKKMVLVSQEAGKRLETFKLDEVFVK